jgi:hypothetical protein
MTGGAHAKKTDISAGLLRLERVAPGGEFNSLVAVQRRPRRQKAVNLPLEREPWDWVPSRLADSIFTG